MIPDNVLLEHRDKDKHEYSYPRFTVPLIHLSSQRIVEIYVVSLMLRYSIHMLNKLLALMVMIMLSIQLSAQFNPPNPQEPGKPVFYYKVLTSSLPADIAWTSGDGSYSSGSLVWINTSLRNDQYAFSHWTWTVDGQEYSSQEQGFEYTMTDKDVTFVAHYTFTPTSPEDPSTILKSRLFLSCIPEGVATFNHSNGERIPVGSTCSIDAYPNQGYKFMGWYQGEEKISDDMTFDYTIPNSDSYLVAHFTYNPTSPEDPDDDGTLLKLGDANGDGVVNMEDLKMFTDKTLDKPMPSNFQDKIVDMNGDGVINAQDLTILTNMLIK